MTRYAKHTKIRIILHHAPMNDECVFFFNYPMVNKESHKPAKQPWLEHIKYVYIYIILYHIIPYIRIIQSSYVPKPQTPLGPRYCLVEMLRKINRIIELFAAVKGHRGNTKQDWPVLFYHNLNSDFTFVFLGVALSNGDVASNSRGDLTGIMVNLFWGITIWLWLT